MQPLASAGAGFLLAVLWFDLMFDVQVLRVRDSPPEEAVASIATYYRRVTTNARPMNRLVAVGMLATMAAVVTEVVRGSGPSWVAWTSLVLIVGAVSLAAGRTVPNAVRLGTRRDPLPAQRALARSILRDHLVCLSCVATLLVLQLSTRL